MSNKTADEMFEELGYETSEKLKNGIVYLKEEEDEDKKLNEQEVEVSHRISNLLQTNPNYINKRGYVAIAYI